jgi:predicted nucleic acid-binding protein
VAALDRELAELAARFKAEHGLGLADAFAAALSKTKKAELATSDPDFKLVEQAITVAWIR